MRKLFFAFVLTLVPSFLTAADRNQSYVTFDEGDSVVRQASDDRDIAVRLNLPIYPGDELRTSRRGRTEVRLADGNVVAIDRNSILRFQSILNSLEGENSSTVLILEAGQAISHRTERSNSPVRIDTAGASYVSSSGAIYSVEVDQRGSDLLAVYEGSVEVRTPAGTSRVRSGEQTKVDQRGVFASNELLRGGSSDFERWYLKRASRHARGSSRYLDRSLSYADYELNDHGSWIYVSEYGWTWRPRVSTSWRPYYYGNWSHTPSGRLSWVSDEPWGWVPYHYGRWAQSPLYGWVWVPGSGYSHAWVYWLYGPQYLGWIPAGYYDCYRPYYNNLYTPYARLGFDAGFGFHGRVRIHDIDLNNWTFLNSGQIISTRVDRAAVTADVVRARLTRDNPSITVSNIQARFGRSDLSNPGSVIEAIGRRGLGGGTGTENAGSEPDAAAFIRRDPALSTSVLERIGRPQRGGSPDAGSSPRTVAGGSGAPAPRQGAISIDRSRPARTGEAVGREPAAGVDRGRSAPAIEPRPAVSTPRSGVDRGRDSGTTSPQPAVERGRTERSREDSPANDWRERTGSRPSDTSTAPPTQAPSRQPAVPSRDWRSSEGGVSRDRGAVRPRNGEEVPNTAQPSRSGDAPSSAVPRERVGRTEKSSPHKDDNSWRNPTSREGDDTPRRVIDQIGGARVTPRNSDGDAAPRARTSRSGDSSGSGRSSTPRGEASTRESSPASSPRVERQEPRNEAPRSESPRSEAPRSESSPPQQKSSDSDSSNIKPN